MQIKIANMFEDGVKRKITARKTGIKLATFYDMLRRYRLR
jgi:hypothetical protein